MALEEDIWYNTELMWKSITMKACQTREESIAVASIDFHGFVYQNGDRTEQIYINLVSNKCIFCSESSAVNTGLLEC